MRKRHILAALLALMTVGLLAGCGGAATVESESAEAVPVVSQEEDKVIAEGSIEPVRWAELRFENGGTAVEVLVQEGDVVSQDDLLVHFDPTDAQLVVQEAQAALASAQAQLAQVKAPPRQEEIAVAEARLAVAEGALAQAAAQRDQLAAGATDAEVAAAQAQLAQAMAQQLQAEDAHDATMKCFKFTRPDGTKDKFCPALGLYEELARYQMLAADDALVAAQAQLEAAQGGAGAQLRAARAAVDSATAQRDAAQAQLDLAKAGSTPEQVAAAQAQVTQAKAALATAQAALDRTEVRAPFAGTVVEVTVDADDTARPGQVIVVLATLDRLQARTIDLTELDVARVAEGQPVVVTVDALPDAPLSGRVLRIDEQSEDYRGDVVYPVIVELDGDTTALRWGMTTMVEIEVE
jgi:multidrug efflux pump subunit AcrA (membrane-fusion protein)